MGMPSWESQKADWVRDLEIDAAQSLKQAEEGPFFPERGITPESLRDYAEQCLAQAKDPHASLVKALQGSPIAWHGGFAR